MRSHLPAHFHQLMPESFLDLSYKEALVTCSSCPMAERGTYKPNLKCCTFFPFTPNFMVSSLAQQKPSEFKQWLKKRRFVLPIGVVAPGTYQLAFRHKGAEDFGNDSDLLCPFYKGGGCSIWSIRGSECSGFHCQSQYGDLGKAFWSMWSETFFAIESYLAQEMMLNLGFHWPEVEENLDLIRMTDFDTHGVEALSQDHDQRLWGHRAKDKEHFFLEAAELYKEIRFDKLPAELQERIRQMTSLWRDATA